GVTRVSLGSLRGHSGVTVGSPGSPWSPRVPPGLSRSRAAAVTLLVTSAASALASLWLGAVLLFRLRDLCVVCVSTYGVNLALLWLNLTQKHPKSD
uniref:vitamin-K-epoxide reductase (warfarin-sensitive) n=1 Tax=Cyanistes caeruleus TaxID=156563 RepID=A0A8C0U6S9_CYACU